MNSETKSTKSTPVNWFIILSWSRFGSSFTIFQGILFPERLVLSSYDPQRSAYGTCKCIHGTRHTILIAFTLDPTTCFLVCVFVSVYIQFPMLVYYWKLVVRMHVSSNDCVCMHVRELLRYSMLTCSLPLCARSPDCRSVAILVGWWFVTAH